MSNQIKLLLSLILILVSIILIWIGFPFLNEYLIGNSLEFDRHIAHYNAFSALFSALAFAGVIATLIFQSRELELQRTELINSVNAQKDSARALEDQARKSLLAIQADAYFKVIETLQSKEAIEAREMVFNLKKDDILKEYSEWTDKEKAAAEELMRRYDSIGIMAFNEMVPYELIVDSWGSSLKRSWDIVKVHLDYLRTKRDAPEFWDDYEWLVKKAVEYETDYIKQNLTYQSGKKVELSLKRHEKKSP